MVERSGFNLADQATILANTRALTRLCHALAAFNVIPEKAFEQIRHDHLGEFDRLFADLPMPPVVAKEFETRRAAIDAMWQV